MTRVDTTTKTPGLRADPMVAKLRDPRAESIPCPVLRTLVNEDLLTPDKDGMVDVAQLKRALKEIGISAPVRALLAGGAKNNEAGSFLASLRMNEFSLFKLAGSGLDHKADTQILRGGFQQDRLDRLLSFSSDGESITIADLARAQKQQLAEEPTGARGTVLGVAELAAVLLVFGRPNDDGVKGLRKQDVVSLYRDAKFPEGWQPQDVGLMELVAAMAKLAYHQKTSTPGRAQAGLDKALGRPEMLEQSAVKGLKNAMCPVGMRPTKASPPVSTAEVVALHQKGAGADQAQV